MPAVEGQERDQVEHPDEDVQQDQEVDDVEDAALGRLPGDIAIERESVRIYAPIVSMIVLSIILTIVLNVALRIWR